MTSSSSSCELISDETERRSLKPLTKTTNKKSNYGSLRTEVPSQTINYKHRLKQGETLQGISLKYGVPIELIKRANKLWSNDLAFVKDILIVPIDKTRLKDMNLEEQDVVDSEQINAKVDTSEQSNGGTYFKDYLNKFDSIISESKLKLKTLETCPNMNGLKNSASYASHEDMFKKAQKKQIDENLQQQQQQPELLITSPNMYSNFYTSNHHLIKTSSSSLSRARMAQENLERLEREKDDLFEL